MFICAHIFFIIYSYKKTDSFSLLNSHRWRTSLHHSCELTDHCCEQDTCMTYNFHCPNFFLMFISHNGSIQIFKIQYQFGMCKCYPTSHISRVWYILRQRLGLIICLLESLQFFKACNMFMISYLYFRIPLFLLPT